MVRIVSSADEPLGTICFVLSATGMRIGEVLGSGLRTWTISEASIASLPMPLAFAIRLKTFLASRHFRQTGLGLLFANRRGRPFSANKLREKKLRPLLSSLGIQLAGFHAFRHGVATTLIDRGASITTVGAQLRHSDPRITLGLYAHVVPKSQRDAVEGLVDAISPGQLLTQA
jgi:integrase